MVEFGRYEKEPSIETAVDLLLEVGDIIVQKTTIDLYHRTEEAYPEVAKKFESALSYIGERLEKQGLGLAIAPHLAKVKYGLRAASGCKDKELEREVCLLELKSAFLAYVTYCDSLRR